MIRDRGTDKGDGSSEEKIQKPTDRGVRSLESKVPCDDFSNKKRKYRKLQ